MQHLHDYLGMSLMQKVSLNNIQNMQYKYQIHIHRYNQTSMYQSPSVKLYICIFIP